MISECAGDSAAATMLTSVCSEQSRERGESAAYQLDWAQEVFKAVESKQSKAAPIELGDVAVPFKLKDVPLSIVLDVQYGKCGLLDLNTGEPKYFATEYLKRVFGPRLQ